MSEGAGSQGGGAGQEETWSVVLVHGIGLTQPIDMIEEVATALCAPEVCPNLQIEGPIEAHKRTFEYMAPVPPVSPGGMTIEAAHNLRDMHRIYSQSAKFPGGRVQFVAAHWSDISFYRDGVVNLLAALLLTSFGVRYFARAASSQTTFVSRLLTYVLDLFVHIVALIAFPLTFVSFIFSIMAILFEYTLRYDWIPAQSYAISIAGMIVGLGIAAIWLSKIHEMEQQRPLPLARPIAASIAVFSVLIGLMILVGHWVDNQPQFKDIETAPVRNHLVQFMQLWGNELIGPHWLARVKSLDRIGIYFGLLHWVQVWVAVVLIFLTFVILVLLVVNYLTARFVSGSGRSLVLSGIAVVSIWIINLILLWPENLATFGAMTAYSRLSNDVVSFPTIGFSDGWIKFVTTELSMTTGNPPPGVKRLSDYYPLLWFEAIFLVFVVVLIFASVGLIVMRSVWLGIQRWSKLDLYRPDGKRARPRLSNWPRLIVAPVYIGLVLVLMTVVSIVGAAQAIGWDGHMARMLGIAFLGDTPSHELAVPSEYVRVVVIASLTGFLLLTNTIRTGMKLVLDVVNHFTGRDPEFPVRKRIAARLKEAIEFELAQGKRPNLIILAHSQGTVLAIDALIAGLWDDVKDRVETLTILTFGSPLTHVYQRYFSLRYKPLKSIANIASLTDEPRFKWFNVYRIDDYVGTYIENSVPGFPVNVPCKPGGHMDYWRTDVLTRLFAEPGMAQVLAGARAQPKPT